MEDKIKKLKELGIVYKCALEYDYCPDSDEVDNIIENIIEDYNKDDMIKLLDKYEGSSPNDISSNVFALIDKL